MLNNIQTDCHTLKYGFMITSWSCIPKKVILWLLEMETTFATFNVMIKSLRTVYRRKYQGSPRIIILILVITSLIYVKLQIKNWILYSEYQLIWPQINVACWLILLLNLTSVIARLFGCSVIEKTWRKSTKYKNVIYV